MTQLAIIEKNDNTRKTLTDFFSSEKGVEVSLYCSSFTYFKEQWVDKQLDFVLCDMCIQDKPGIDAVYHIKDISRQTEVMMLTDPEDEDEIFQSLRAGASGYIFKSASLGEIKAGMHDILNGGAVMSPKIAGKTLDFFDRKSRVRKEQTTELIAEEIEILAFLKQDYSNEEIAVKTYLSVDMVKFHIKNIYLKLQIGSRAELIARYRTQV